MILEVEKSHNLPAASWITKKAGNVIHFKSKGLRTGGTDVWGPEKMDVIAKAKSRFALPLPFCSIQTLLFKLTENELWNDKYI